jgi:hypothetical protein
MTEAEVAILHQTLLLTPFNVHQELALFNHGGFNVALCLASSLGYRLNMTRRQQTITRD